MRKSILVVEDNVLVGRSVRMLLRSFGHDVTLFEDTRPAQAYVAANGLADIDLVISDFDLPSETGYEFIRKLWEQRPELKVLLMSAWAEESIVPSPRPADWPPFISKPFKPAALREAVSKVFEVVEVERLARRREVVVATAPIFVEVELSPVS
jgi:CheY-like chemotaxis protein